jgi:hypothetical protein
VGDADQFIKRIFRDETSDATRSAVRFESAPEIATASLTPDGFLTLVGSWSTDTVVLPPWTQFPYRAVVDFKMEGDHVDAAALARVELRRQAAWVQHLEARATRGDTQPARYATLVVAPHLPDWLRQPSLCAPLTVTMLAPGCYGITPRDHPVLWVAANELPLHPSLVPFLWARSGVPRVAFVRWLAMERGVASVVAMIQSHPMSAQIAQQLFDTPEEQAAYHQRGLEMAHILLARFPEAAREIRDDAERKGIDAALRPLEHMFARRLGRALTPADHTTLVRRLGTHGPDRLGDVVLDLDRAALERWLADPDAR